MVKSESPPQLSLNTLLQWGRYLWMHNGVVGGFMTVRRAMLAALSDAAYNTVQSFHSDSAVAFALFLHHLPDLGAQLQPSQLLNAMEARSTVGYRFGCRLGLGSHDRLCMPPGDVLTLTYARSLLHLEVLLCSLSLRHVSLMTDVVLS